ncbi:MAG: metallophosphoesterase [Chloroflexota bacterium]|nr:metallophosphoesterase [Chloroflexota bacterium]
MGDIHCTRDSAGALRELFTQAAASADVLALCGDLTDYGLAEEAEILVAELAAAGGTPIVAVLGNHDHESGDAAGVARILTDAGVRVLDGDAVELAGIGFAGTKGFGGGFGAGALGYWGEEANKRFVQEALDEALKLEAGLARLRAEPRVALLHYAPIRGTVEREPEEIFAFLGSSRLEEPLARYGVTAVLHGHAHKGTPEGRTASGAPVYNVSIPLLREMFPDRPPFRVVDLSVVPEQGLEP